MPSVVPHAEAVTASATKRIKPRARCVRLFDPKTFRRIVYSLCVRRPPMAAMPGSRLAQGDANLTPFCKNHEEEKTGVGDRCRLPLSSS